MPRRITLWHIWDESDPAATQRFCLSVESARKTAELMDRPSRVCITTVRMTKRGVAYALENYPITCFDAEAEADARLIEAAPEILEALEELVCCPAFTGKLFETDKRSHRAWTLARAAIAKATNGEG
jgi:hypothetical protein